jgi:hypothetical protein
MCPSQPQHESTHSDHDARLRACRQILTAALLGLALWAAVIVALVTSCRVARAEPAFSPEMVAGWEWAKARTPAADWQDVTVVVVGSRSEMVGGSCAEAVWPRGIQIADTSECRANPLYVRAIWVHELGHLVSGREYGAGPGGFNSEHLADAYALRVWPSGDPFPWALR